MFLAESPVLSQQFLLYSNAVAMLGLGAFAIFFLANKDKVIELYRGSMVTSAMICAVASVAYFFIWRDNTPGGVFPTALRYVDWTVTTPLLLAKYNELVRARGYKFVTTLIVADLFMIVTGFIGETYGQVVNGTWLPYSAGAVAAHYIWGAISTVGYVVIIYMLWVAAPKLAATASPHIQRGIRSLNWYIVTLWGVYPIVYILEAVSVNHPGLDLNWAQVASSVADFLNKALFGVSAYLIVKAVSGDDQNDPDRPSLEDARTASPAAASPASR